MIKLSHGNIFLDTSLCEGNPHATGGIHQKGPSNEELWCFLWYTPEQTVKTNSAVFRDLKRHGRHVTSLTNGNVNVFCSLLIRFDLINGFIGILNNAVFALENKCYINEGVKSSKRCSKVLIKVPIVHDILFGRLATYETVWWYFLFSNTYATPLWLCNTMIRHFSTCWLH